MLYLSKHNNCITLTKKKSKRTILELNKIECDRDDLIYYAEDFNIPFINMNGIKERVKGYDNKCTENYWINERIEILSCYGTIISFIPNEKDYGYINIDGLKNNPYKVYFKTVSKMETVKIIDEKMVKEYYLSHTNRRLDRTGTQFLKYCEINFFDYLESNIKSYIND